MEIKRLLCFKIQIAELDDIFGNTFGGIIGVLIAYGLLNRRKRKILRKGSVLIED